MIRDLPAILPRDDDGTTAAEYAVMLLLITLAVVSAVTAVGNSTAAGWSHNADQVASACNKY